jgi:ABC-type Zn uptake system ZnuABC Zn-binding protein ZnuA
MSSSISRRSFLMRGLAFALVPAALPRISTLAQDDSVPPFGSPVALPAIDPRADGHLTVVTSTSILADLARQVAGDRAEVISILPPNADPHDFEPAPDDIIAIEDADLVILHGLHLDNWADGLIEASQSDAPVVVATTGIETIHSDEDHAEEESSDDDHDHDESEGDPHVWFDPMRAKQMVANIRDGLIAIDPDGADGYQERFDAYAAQLDTLDAEIQQRVDLIPEDRRKLVTNHDSLAYYAERYGLEVVGTVIPGLDTRTEPSAKEVAELIEKIQESGVSVIFVENTVGPALAESLASDAGIRVAPDLYTDSLGDAESGADSYIGLMQTDTIIIVENLRSA